VSEKKSKKERIVTRRRRQILKAGLTIFARKGYAAATIPEIARAAGVAAGTIYLYFPSKRELFVNVIKHFIITSSLLELINKIPEGDIPTIIKSILKERLALMNNRVISYFPSIMGEVRRDPELRKLWIKDFLQPFLGMMSPGYRMMAAMGKFREFEPEVAVRAVGGMIIGFMMLKILEGESSPLNKMDQDKIADNIATILLYGLLKQPEGGR
jgi:AcrR family transcriptional regulator